MNLLFSDLDASLSVSAETPWMAEEQWSNIREYLNLSLISSSDSTRSGLIPALNQSPLSNEGNYNNWARPETALISTGGARLPGLTSRGNAFVFVELSLSILKIKGITPSC